MKILSLDGGGSWALIQARCLMDLYGDITGNEVLRKYDMAIANSGGSIVLACLVENKKLSEIVAMFRDEQNRKDMFSSFSFWNKPTMRIIRKLAGIGPKYTASKKLDGLRKHLPIRGGMYLADLPGMIGKPELQLIICSFDYERNRAVFFRSNMKSMADSGYYDHVTNGMEQKFGNVTLAEAAHGASNAPVNYFDEPAEIQFKAETFKRQYWDGAIGGYNNPVFAGVLEAIANGVNAEDIKVLSLGTSTVTLPLLLDQNPKPTADGFLYRNEKNSFTNDIRKLATAIVDDPPDSSSYHAYAVMHKKIEPLSTRFFRFSPLIRPAKKNGSWKVPKNFTADEFEKLINLDMDAVAQEDVNRIDKLCDEWMNPGGEIDNQAVRSNGSLQCMIGYGTYQLAKSSFLKNF